MHIIIHNKSKESTKQYAEIWTLSVCCVNNTAPITTTINKEGLRTSKNDITTILIHYVP